MNNLIKILRFAPKNKLLFFAYFFFVFIAAICNTLTLAMMAPLMDYLYQIEEIFSSKVDFPSFSIDNVNEYFKVLFYYYAHSFYQAYGSIGGLYFISICIVSLSFIGNAAKYLEIYTSNVLNLNILQNLRNVIFEHVLKFDYLRYRKFKKANIIMRFTTDINYIQQFFVQLVLFSMRDILQVGMYLVGLFYISFQLSLFSLIIFPLTAWFIQRLVKKIRAKLKIIIESHTSLYSIVDSILNNFKIVKVFQLNNFFVKKYKQENYNNTVLSKKLKRRESAAPTISEFFSVISLASVLIFGGYLILDKETGMNAGKFVAFLAIYSQLLKPAKSLVSNLSVYMSAMAAADRIFDLLNTKPFIKSKKNAHVIDEIKDKISFENVSLSLGDKKVLSNISFDIKKGETVALVGNSGGGKTTIINLLCRFYEVDSGCIKIDGKDLRDISLDSLYPLIGLVSQDSELFNETIYQNILYGKFDASKKEVEEASRIAHVDEFVKEMDKGYDTMIGDDGYKISGGQKQRLSIARAIIKRPGLLLLDEATSALDSKSEMHVKVALQNILKNFTSLIVAHRLSTIKHADKIIVLDRGKIVETGTHEQLIEKKGKYYELNNTQIERKKK